LCKRRKAESSGRRLTKCAIYVIRRRVVEALGSWSTRVIRHVIHDCTAKNNEEKWYFEEEKLGQGFHVNIYVGSALIYRKKEENNNIATNTKSDSTYTVRARREKLSQGSRQL
jgi:hypothetical protein